MSYRTGAPSSMIWKLQVYLRNLPRISPEVIVPSYIQRTIHRQKHAILRNPVTRWIYVFSLDDISVCCPNCCYIQYIYIYTYLRNFPMKWELWPISHKKIFNIPYVVYIYIFISPYNTLPGSIPSWMGVLQSSKSI